MPSSEESFGQPNDTQIRPGVEITIGNSSCTSNFIFTLNASTYYIGTAAHCFSPDSNSDVDPCEARSEPLGFSEIEIDNASHPGELVYSSWLAMQESGETRGSEVCRYNDFALIQIHPEDIHNIHPAAIPYGGPVGIQSSPVVVGETVYSYGQSDFHLGSENLKAKQGEITAIESDESGVWRYRIFFDSAGTPGDSGSAVLHQNGNALAVLTVIGTSDGPVPVANGAVDLQRALNYAKMKGYIHPDVQVLTWPVFSP